jgi:hypothetical protein
MVQGAYEQAVEVLRALLADPEHAAPADRYRGFDGGGDRWKGSAPVSAAGRRSAEGLRSL